LNFVLLRSCLRDCGNCRPPSGTSEAYMEHPSEKNVVAGRVAGRAGVMHVIAPSMPQHVCLWQGRQRPTPRLCAAGEVINFAHVVVYGGLRLQQWLCRPRSESRRGNTRHCPRHAATRRPPAGPPEAHAEIFFPQAKSVISRLWLFTASTVVLLAAWRVVQGQCAPSPYACRSTLVPGRSAGIRYFPRRHSH
jgi:hypothetical protein